MPRKVRIDAPGALHHIIVKGIERRKIFLDDFDRNNFLKHFDNVLSETATPKREYLKKPLVPERTQEKDRYLVKVSILHRDSLQYWQSHTFPVIF
jgi:hypothetical protein